MGLQRVVGPFMRCTEMLASCRAPKVLNIQYSIFKKGVRRDDL